MKTKGTTKKCRIRNGLNVQDLSFLREKWEKISMDEIELTIAMDCVERAKHTWRIVVPKCYEFKADGLHGFYPFGKIKQRHGLIRASVF